MQFSDVFPERTVAPPQLPGQPIYTASVLNGLRLQQLRDLAYAFDVEIKTDGTKPEVLPAMLAAESAGIFQQQPKRPEFLVKASRSADEPHVDWQSYAKKAEPNFRQLQQLAKEHGVNAFQKGEEELRSELKAAGVL